jgi:hypothetical protein
MILSRESKKCILKSATLEQVATFKYLGTVIIRGGRIDEEINTRIASTGNLYNMVNNNFINKNEVSKKTKLTVYKTTYLPTSSYNSEIWPLTTNILSRYNLLK